MTDDRTIAQYAGFFDPGNINAAVIGTAVALAESGGDERKLNDNPATHDLSYGLWQINMYGSLGPSRRRQFGLSRNEDLFNPETNAKAAWAIYSSQGWGAWGAYTNGSYKDFLDRATKAATEPEPVTGSTSDLSVSARFSDSLDLLDPAKAFQVLVAPIKNMLDILANATSWITDPDNWIRIVQVGGGIALAIVAAAVVIKPPIKVDVG